MSRTKKQTVQYRWEAYDPDTRKVMKRGPIREDLVKTEKYADEILETIVAGKMAPYWDGLQLRIITRTISPWSIISDSVETTGTPPNKAMQSQASEVKV